VANMCIAGFKQEEYPRVSSADTHRWETLHMQHVSRSFPVSCWIDCTWKNTHRGETLSVWSVWDGISMSCNFESAQGMSKICLFGTYYYKHKHHLLFINLQKSCFD